MLLILREELKMNNDVYAQRKKYSKDRLKQLKDPDLIKSRPYWKYISNVTMIEPCHKQWDGLVLQHDDPWWKKHFPPNGSECRCRVTAVRAKEYTEQTAPSD
ncbi:hypothetical protein BMR05_01095 [Methylococcaceae bacterium HT4]|nr:hypothetical protein BMR05_01095 [Methylococcaceae bacterium HT4]